MALISACPYVFCSANVRLTAQRISPTSETTRLLVAYHQINHPWLTGGCPASHMWVPLDEAAAELLTERAVTDRRTIEERMEREDEMGPRPTNYEGRDGGEFPIRPLYPRQPGQLPGRMGREPGPHSGVWNPPRPGDPENQVRPPGVSGHPIGKGSGRHVASIREVVGQVTEANVKTGEAAASAVECAHVLQAAHASIEEAVSYINQAIDGSGAQTLGEYLALLNQASQDINGIIPQIQDAAAKLTAGMERGETYIGMALG